MRHRQTRKQNRIYLYKYIHATHFCATSVTIFFRQTSIERIFCVRGIFFFFFFFFWQYSSVYGIWLGIKLHLHGVVVSRNDTRENACFISRRNTGKWPNFDLETSTCVDRCTSHVTFFSRAISPPLSSSLYFFLSFLFSLWTVEISNAEAASNIFH